MLNALGPKNKKPHPEMRFFGACKEASDAKCSALACFELALRLVDDVNAALATHNPAVTVPVLQRAERVLDLHGLSPFLRREPAPGLAGRSEPKFKTAKSWWAVQGSNL